MTDKERTDRVEDPGEDRALSAFLEAVGPTLRDPAVWAEPPPALEESIIAAIAAEKGGAAEPAATEPMPATAPVPPVPSAVAAAAPEHPRRSVPRAVVWMAVAAAAAIVGIALGLVTRDGGGGDEELHLAGTDLAPEAEATVEVEQLSAGVALALDIHGLEPAPAGSYYQGWVRSPETEPVSVGTFHMRGGDSKVTLWSGVPIAEHPILTITLQKEGGGAETSGIAYLRGNLMP